MRTITKHDAKAEKIWFLDEGFYTNNNETYYPGATTILEVYPKGFGFDQWLKDVGSNATQIADRAALVGHKIHDYSELLNKGESIEWTAEFSKQEWQLLCRFVEFWNVAKPKLIANELPLVCPELGYGGTLDRVVELNGSNWLIDIKTSNYIHKAHELQLAAYAKLWNWFNPETPINHTAILWLKANTRTDKCEPEAGIWQGKGWQLKTFERHYNQSFKLFQYTQSIWEEENPNAKPMNQCFPTKLKL